MDNSPSDAAGLLLAFDVLLLVIAGDKSLSIGSEAIIETKRELLVLK